MIATVLGVTYHKAPHCPTAQYHIRFDPPYNDSMLGSRFESPNLEYGVMSISLVGDRWESYLFESDETGIITEWTEAYASSKTPKWVESLNEAGYNVIFKEM